MTRTALETIEEFWQRQDSGDYTQVVSLFADNAVLEDPFFGRFEGREAIAEFMGKMVEVMGERKTHFTVKEIAGGGEVAWARWIAHTPRGDIEGCGLYRVVDGYMTYYCDYMNNGENPETT
ncbi:MAG: nuclear transport factor 2 family protein [Pseudomonadota bacterium]